LNAGTYTGLTGDIMMKSNVTLRGAGADQTILKFLSGGGSGCGLAGGLICLTNGDNGNDASSQFNKGTWAAASYAPGQTQITLTVTAGSIMAAGRLMVLYQSDPASDPGTIFNCQAAACSSELHSGANGPTGNSQTQTVTVTAVTGTGPYTVTFSPGLYSPIWNDAAHCASSGCALGAYWSTVAPITGAGVENITLDATATTDSPGVAGSLVQMFWASGNWVTGVRTLNTGTPPYRNNMLMYQSVHNTLESNYAYGSNGYDLSYGYEIGWESSDNLADNNIFQHVASPEILTGGQGIVFAYNYAVDDYYTAQGSAPSFQQSDMYAVHQDGSYYDLFEGNTGVRGAADAVAGTGWMTTYFRNRTVGRDGAFKTSQTSAFEIDTYNRYYNVVGNVFGVSGYHTNYKIAATTTSDNASCNTNTENQSIILLGYGGGNACSCNGTGLCANNSLPNDTLVPASTYLWGNYDTATAGVRWCGNSSDPGWTTTCSGTSEVPTGLSSYAQTVPSSTTLPSSFFYNSKPAWYASPYGNPPFPAVGPDVTGGSGPGGHSYQTPAQLCFSNTAYDTNYAVQATITSITENGITATMTLSASAPAAFTQYQSFWITGSSLAGYNGLQQIASVSGSTITFIAPSGLGSASGGTATVNAIHVFNANNCYPPSGNLNPAPPTGLSAIVK
jgi:hypothetical protein